MNESFRNVFHFGGVLISCKPRESLLKHVYSERVITCHEHINSKIILKIVDEMGICNIFGNKNVLFAFNGTVLVYHFNAPSTG